MAVAGFHQACHASGHGDGELFTVGSRQVVPHRRDARIARASTSTPLTAVTQVATGAPLFMNHSVAWAEGRRPVEVVLSYLRGDRYKLVLRATRQVAHTVLELAQADATAR